MQNPDQDSLSSHDFASKMEKPDQDSSYSEDVTKISADFVTQLKITEENHAKEEEEEDESEEDEEESDEEEFSFMCEGANTSPIAAEDAFINGQIKPIFPLFNRDLLFSGEDSDQDLPMNPPVKRVFVETANNVVTSLSQENDGAAGPYCDLPERKAVEASPEMSKKSNSTGFSKIWRFKDLMSRSNSDGRDAFVFLNNAPPSTVSPPPEKGKAAVKGKAKKKGKTMPLSAHEIYLKSKAKEGDKKRSYLPYKPELMGFFTNVNGGLSRNVHPF